MIALERITSAAAPFPGSNLDTDQIIPARFLSRSRGEGFGAQLFHDLRYQADGSENPGFVLCQPGYTSAKILVGERNFACGSSREHAVWALSDYGVRAVIAISFGDIFQANSLKNGLLPVSLPERVIRSMIADLQDCPGSEVTVDLRRQMVTAPDGTEHAFLIDPFSRECILGGLDELDLTLRQRPLIEAFEQRYGREND
jgi:3-isopropylmalate/(R)-2-methylmalate dehydratase small subunit